MEIITISITQDNPEAINGQNLTSHPGRSAKTRFYFDDIAPNSTVSRYIVTSNIYFLFLSSFSCEFTYARHAHILIIVLKFLSGNPKKEVLSLF